MSTSSLADLLAATSGPQAEQDICVIRLSSTTWSNKRGVYVQKSLTYLRRQCQGYNILEEDLGAIGPRDVVDRIVDLNNTPDGVYLVVPCNERRDYESGVIDDYDYRLLPYVSTAHPQ